MSSLTIKLFVSALIAINMSYFAYYYLIKIPPRPELDEYKWWGVLENETTLHQNTTTIKPYQIKICENDLQDLNDRLDKVRKFSPPLEGIEHQYGLNTNLLQTFLDDMKISYKWKDREEILNKFPHFMTSIQGLRIHFYHVKPTDQKTEDTLKILPLLLVHGWPSSSIEFFDLIPNLIKSRNGTKFAFEVIAPDIPGFGLSEGSLQVGMGSAQIAVLFKNLMERLGFHKFYVHGGDFGAAILRFLSVIYPESVLGYHSSMCAVNTPLSVVKTIAYSFYPTLWVKKDHIDRMYPLKSWLRFMLQETGYMHLQITKPDTIGVALKDSPVGLMAYMLEKYITLANFTYVNRLDGGLEKYNRNAIFDNVLLYWFSGCISTSMRLYAETFNFEQIDWFRQLVTVPSACARFTYDLYSPDSALKEVFINLVHLVDYDGGHFPALLTPDVLVDDIFVSVGKFRELQ